MLRFAVVISTVSIAACGSSPTTRDSAEGSGLVVSESRTTLSAEDDAVLVLPVVSGGAPGVAARINEALTPEALLGDSVAGIKKEYAGCQCGTVGASFQVAWARPPVLQIVVSVESLGAYPSSDRTAFTFDSETGAHIGVDQLFTADRAALVAKVDAELQGKLRETVARAHADGVTDMDDELAGRFEAKDVGLFMFGPRGMSFDWSLDLPHAIQALEPDFPELPWAVVAPYLTPRYRATVPSGDNGNTGVKPTQLACDPAHPEMPCTPDYSPE